MEIIGAIFDSCPGPPSTIPYIAAKFGITSTHDIPVFFPFTLLPFTYGYFHHSLAKSSLSESIYKGFNMLPVSFKNYFKYGAKNWPGVYLIHYEQEKWPLLFLYSKKDVMIPYLYISHAISVKKQQNPSRNVSEKLFENSAHAAHLRTYPQEYKNEIKQFLKQC